jgi:hypothetical protein
MPIIRADYSVYENRPRKVYGSWKVVRRKLEKRKLEQSWTWDFLLALIAVEMVRVRFTDAPVLWYTV